MFSARFEQLSLRPALFCILPPDASVLWSNRAPPVPCLSDAMRLLQERRSGSCRPNAWSSKFLWFTASVALLVIVAANTRLQAGFLQQLKAFEQGLDRTQR